MNIFFNGLWLHNGFKISALRTQNYFSRGFSSRKIFKYINNRNILLNHYFKNTNVYSRNGKSLENCRICNKYLSHKLHYSTANSFNISSSATIILFPLIGKKILFKNFMQKVIPSFKGSIRNVSDKKSNITNEIISLKTKKRIQRKRQAVDEHSDVNAEGFHNIGSHKFLTFDPDFDIPDKLGPKFVPREFSIVAYATANEYDLQSLSKALLKQGLYVEIPIIKEFTKDAEIERNIKSNPEDVLHFGAAYQVSSEPRTMYIFQNGAVVFWNMPLLERTNILKFLRKFESGSYDKGMIHEESEKLIYGYTDSNAKLIYKQNLVLLNEAGQKYLEKFAFSNALTMSVKLGIWEASLDRYIENIEDVTEELQKTGVVLLNQEQVLQRLGQLFGLRHLINLSSDLLDTPDFYWDHENLENLYMKMANHLSIQKRTSVMNIKLSHCLELMELLQSHLHDRHSSRLEWIIIILIMIEVFFEVLHFL